MSDWNTINVSKDSFFYSLNGSIKILFMAIWTVIVFAFLDLRIFIGMFLIGISLLLISQIPMSKISWLIWLMVSFNIINAVFIIILSPSYATTYTNTHTPIISIGYDTINLETLFYVLTLTFKYLALLPIAILFMFTTHPSQFASSLNRIGVPYKIAYAVGIAFRYIPDLKKEYKTITHSLQMRGIGFKKGEASWIRRVKNIKLIVFPLIISSLHRIETVTHAMELRGFGKQKTRTWYTDSPLQLRDYLVLSFGLILLILGWILKRKEVVFFWFPFE